MAIKPHTFDNEQLLEHTAEIYCSHCDSRIYGNKLNKRYMRSMESKGKDSAELQRKLTEEKRCYGLGGGGDLGDGVLAAQTLPPEFRSSAST